MRKNGCQKHEIKRPGLERKFVFGRLYFSFRVVFFVIYVAKVKMKIRIPPGISFPAPLNGSGDNIYTVIAPVLHISCQRQRHSTRPASHIQNPLVGLESAKIDKIL